MTQELKILRALMLSTVLASCAVLIPFLSVSKIHVDTKSFLSVVSTVALLIVAAIGCRLRDFIKSSLIMEVLAGGIALSVIVLISSYLAISVNAPLMDAGLAAMDRWMGFDGVAFIQVIDGFPALSWALALAYSSFALQLMVLPILLILFGQPARAFTLVLAYAVVCYLSSVISIWIPALGSYVFYEVDLSSLNAINPSFVLPVFDQFTAVRDQAEFVLSLQAAQGILTFPSVHAAVAFLCASAAFAVPLLRYPFLVLNVLMVISTVSHSNHYLIDVFAGVGVAVFSLHFIRTVARLLSDKRDYVLSPSGNPVGCQLATSPAASADRAAIPPHRPFHGRTT